MPRSSWTVGGVNGSVAGTFTYTPAAGTVLGAGNNQTLSVAFTPTDTTDYTTASATATINVLQATPTITWSNPANIVYGTALSGTQLDATSSWTVGGVSGSVAGTFTYTPAAGTVLGAGNNQTLSVAFTPTDTTDYTTASATATINVLQATPTITWSNPANIVYGTALSATQLDATSSWTVGGVSGSVAGTFTYTPAAGTVLGAGNNQTLSVTFTPTDTTDYTTASATATINVLQATPTITWANPANIVYGTALSATQLDASSSWTVGGVNGERAGDVHLHPGRGHRSWRRQQPDALGHLHPHRHDRLHHGLRDGDDQCLASDANHHLVQPGEHRLRHGPERHAVGCHAPPGPSAA